MSNYLKLDYKSGTLYEFSASAQEGYEKHISKTGKESYRKFYPKGYTGVLTGVSVRDGNFGKELSLSFENQVFVNFGIFDQKSNIDQYTEQVIKALPALELGSEITVFPYSFTPEGEKYSKTGVSFKKGEEKLIGLTNSYYDKNGDLVSGDVPPIRWKPNPLGGSKKPSAADVETKNEYLIDVMTKQSERLKWVGNGNSAPAPQQSSQEEENNELPF